MEIYTAVLNASFIGFQIGGMIVLVSSGLLAMTKWFTTGLARFWSDDKDTEERLRFAFGHRIVLALEFFIGADIIKSVQNPSFTDLAELGIIVIIRTILHYSLS